MAVRPTRRQVAKGLAWVTPVMVLGAPAARAATSPGPCQPVISVSGDGACKCPGSSSPSDPQAYYLSFCATSDPSCPTPAGSTVTIVEVDGNQGPLTNAPLKPFCSTLPTTVTVNGKCSEVIRFTGANSGNFLTVKYKIGDGATIYANTKVPAPNQTCTFCGTAMDSC
ncbi:hypothetical protein HK411_13935 [Calidifontibacter sp. DB2511S]|nr:hypothetical protein [Calidifontibacter sp. DB2511S]